MAFRGTTVDAGAMARIRKLIEDAPGLTRAELSRQVCAKFGWREADGKFAESACRLFLGRMERRGHVQLPPPRRRGNHRRVGETHEGLWLVGPPADFDEEQLAQPLTVRPIDKEEQLGWELHVERYHYLGACTLVGESLRYVALCGQTPVALLGWASASLHNRPREQYVGWNEEEKARWLHLVANNVRFVVLPWARRPAVASRVLAANLRRLSADWRERYGHPVVLAETFVDHSRFRGTCYRASNWLALGETQGFGRSGLHYTEHGRRKTVLVYPLHRKARQLLRAAPTASAKHPKEGRMQTLDFERLPVDGEGSLFELLESVNDSRKKRGIRHPLAGVLAVALCATFAGARSLSAMAQWAKEQSEDVLKRLGCRRRTPPSEPTIRRNLRNVGVEKFDQLSGAWALRVKAAQAARDAPAVEPTPPLAGKGLAIDGKTLCGSADGKVKWVQIRPRQAASLISATGRGADCFC